MMTILQQRFCAGVMLFCVFSSLASALDPQSQATNNQITNSATPKTHFLNVHSMNFFKILPSPPKPDSKRQVEDKELLHDAMATRTKKQVSKATIATKDSVFDYAAVLGPGFNPAKYPQMAKLFEKIRDDATVAIHSAKNTFHRARPDTWTPAQDEDKNKKQRGYAYPSGHSTRAFLWATLLCHLFPAQQKEINTQARQKAWNRVVLGRHYPNDVYAGEVYGKYLAEEFLKDPKFEQEWAEIVKEMGTATNNVSGSDVSASPQSTTAPQTP